MINWTQNSQNSIEFSIGLNSWKVTYHLTWWHSTELFGIMTPLWEYCVFQFTVDKRFFFSPLIKKEYFIIWSEKILLCRDSEIAKPQSDNIGQHTCTANPTHLPQSLHLVQFISPYIFQSLKDWIVFINHYIHVLKMPFYFSSCQAQVAKLYNPWMS